MANPHHPPTSLVLTNPLATPSQLHRRTAFSSIPQDLQDVIFHSLSKLAYSACLLLELPMSVAAQICVVLARYCLSRSSASSRGGGNELLEDEFAHLAAAAVYTVAKTGSHPVGANSVANAFAWLGCPAPATSASATKDGDGRAGGAGAVAGVDDPREYYLTDTDYLNFQTVVLGLEQKILSAVGYDTHVALPHGLAITYLQALDFLGLPSESSSPSSSSSPSPSPSTGTTAKEGTAAKTKTTRQDLSRNTIAYLNTSLLSPQLLYLTHSPSSLAAAAIYSAAKDLDVKMPECSWWEVFDVEREELGFLVVGMRSLEGWVREKVSEREEDGGLGAGISVARAGVLVVTRKDVEKCLERRGVAVSLVTGPPVGAMADEEMEMMRRMDEDMAGS
ncbi:Cyclin-L2 [Zalerion maritima]|uniref:Cyclin-L2 n=1 Tax=Zalerion maritima TaxID=339359 RepID=A0AAD5WML6_9PEZI|nr:Cyclin-L2 [Zalerion maritima]